MPAGTSRLLRLGALALAVTACGAEPPAAGVPPCDELRLAAEPGPRPVVIVLNDTMRRDRIGAYGGPASTPAFDRFARENLLFEHAYSQAPWTLPAVASLFTSLHPSQHRLASGGRDEGGRLGALPDAAVTLAEVLRDAGYATGAFVSNPWMTARLGLGQGFDRYDDSFAGWDADGRIVVDAALEWLADVPAGRPFLLYVHTIDSHRPYPALDFDDLRAHAARLRADRRDPSPAVRDELRRVVAIEHDDARAAAAVERSLGLLELAYDKGVERFDAALARLLDGLAARPGAADAAVIVTSDHGEALYTRGYGNHGQGLYDDEIAIPLAARLPEVEVAGGVVHCPVELVDVLPTLCVYLGVACPEPVFGASWLPHPGRGSERRYLVAQGLGRRRAIRNARWKLVWQPDGAPDGPRASPWSLYDLAADPGETRDRIDADDPEVRAVAEALRSALPEAVPRVQPFAEERVPIEPEVEARLRELGYLE